MVLTWNTEKENGGIVALFRKQPTKRKIYLKKYWKNYKMGGAMERKRVNTSLGGDALRLTISKVLTLCITMVTTMLLARFRTLEEYGTYSQMLLVINLLASIFMLGLPNSINFFLARAENQDEQRKFLSVYYTASTALSILLGVALVCAVPLIEGYFQNPAIRSFAYFLAIYPWANVISSSIANVLVVYQKIRFLIVFNLIQSITLLGAVVVVQALGLGFREYMICNVAVYSLLALSVYCISSNLCGGMRVSVDWTWIKRILKFSIPLGLASLVGTLDLEIDKLLIGRLMSTSELAVYTNAAKELPVTIVASSITAVLMPRLAKMLKDGRNRDAITLWGTATELSIIVMGLIVAGVVTYAKDVMELLYSAKYLSGVPVFRVYTLTLLLRVTYFGMVLNALGKTRQIMYCSVGALILNAVLNPLLYLCMGIIGPAIATMLSILIITLFQLLLTSKSAGVSFKVVFPWEHFLRVMGTNAVFGAAFYFIKLCLPLDLLIGSIAESILLGITWSCLYFAFMRKRIMKLWHALNHAE